MKTREYHGFSKTPTYQCWLDMIARCTRTTNPAWEDYGGRGISVHPSWMEFSNFVADMGEKPDGLTLDRKNNDGPYSPDNCRWATPQEQAQNQRVRKDNKTGVRGVHWFAKRGLYQVHLCVSGRNKTIGSRADFFEACCLRKSAENRLLNPLA